MINCRTLFSLNVVTRRSDESTPKNELKEKEIYVDVITSPINPSDINFVSLRLRALYFLNNLL